MANSSSSSTSSATPNSKVPVCFFFSKHIPQNISGYEVCREIEKVVGIGNVVGAQFLHGLCRIYLHTMTARNTLLMKGVTIGGIYVAIIDNNPNIVKGAVEKPAVKIIIGNLPISISNELILSSLSQVKGVSIRTRIFEEKYRDESGGLSTFKTGRRFVYADPPEKPLPREFPVGEWRASLYHFGQKTAHTKQNVNNNTQTVSPDTDDKQNSQQTETCQAASDSVSVCQDDQTQRAGEPSAEIQRDVPKGKTKPNQSKIDLFLTPSNRESRPNERGRKPKASESRSQDKSGSRKRRQSQDNQGNPQTSVKSRSRPTSSGTRERSPRNKSRSVSTDSEFRNTSLNTQIDYFDFSACSDSNSTV